MVVYNNESLIERSLSSFADMVDEVLVVHDGPCTDSTLERAKKYTEHIFIREHAGTAESHRAFTYQAARNDWVLQVDADEYLSPELREALPMLVGKNDPAYDIAWPTVIHGTRYHRGYKRALFRKSRVSYIGVTHEFVRLLDPSVVPTHVETPLLHEPDNDDFCWSVFMEKHAPRARVHASELLSDFNKLQKWNYHDTGWNYPMNVQLAYPFVIGMIATPLFHWKEAMKKFVKQPAWYFFKYAFFTGIYFQYLFYLVLRGKRATR
jgi:glycosyltransferase involved in cell wall biosynthesis